MGVVPNPTPQNVSLWLSHGFGAGAPCTGTGRPGEALLLFLDGGALMKLWPFRSLPGHRPRPLSPAPASLQDSQRRERWSGGRPEGAPGLRVLFRVSGGRPEGVPGPCVLFCVEAQGPAR